MAPSRDELLLPVNLVHTASRIGLMLLLAAAFAGLQASVDHAAKATAPKPVSTGATPLATTKLSLEEFKAAVDSLSAGVVDARPRDQFLAGHIPGSVHLPFEAFLEGGKPPAVDFLDPNARAIIYCGGGDCDASHKVQEMLLQFGVANTVVFEPGFPAWEAAGYPVETGPGSSPTP